MLSHVDVNILPRGMMDGSCFSLTPLSLFARGLKYLFLRVFIEKKLFAQSTAGVLFIPSMASYHDKFMFSISLTTPQFKRNCAIKMP
jgi:hypothetical protein